MPSPPSENLVWNTSVNLQRYRTPDSYSGVYFSNNAAILAPWYIKNRTWTRAPAGQRHLTQPYNVYCWNAPPSNPFTLTWQSQYYGIPSRVDYNSMVAQVVPNYTQESWLATGPTYANGGELLDKVRNRCISKAGGATFNSALFLAESHKTLDLLLTNARKIARSFREIKHGRLLGRSLQETVRRACNAIGVTHSKAWDPKASRASQWLEYRYGVETLMSDVRDAAEYAASKASEQREQLSFITESSVTVPIPLQPIDWAMFTHSYDSACNAGYNISGYTKVTAKAWLRTEIEVQGYRTMQQLGFANPVGLAWELIPFSFVADWAFGIGQYLDLQSSLWGLKVIDAGYSLQQDGVVEAQLRVPVENYPSYYAWSLTGSQPVVMKLMRYSRSVWANPTPVYTAGSGLNIKRALDAASLFAVFRR